MTQQKNIEIENKNKKNIESFVNKMNLFIGRKSILYLSILANGMYATD